MKYKSVMDFKVRVLDFISIYAQQKVKNQIEDQNGLSLKLIQGLLTSMKVAHLDGHQILFDRAKTVLSTLSKQGLHSANSSQEVLKEQKILITETMAMLLKPHKDQKLNKAYAECFMMLTKSHFGAD